jgi:probable HAF family extracellular repeat protein
MNNTFRRHAVLLSAALLIMPIGGIYAAAPTYNLVDLGTLGGDGSNAFAIASNGAVVGMSLVASETAIERSHGFLWLPPNRMTDIGTLGGVKSQAEAVNGLGQVTGWSLTSDHHKHAFLWSNDGSPPTDLGTLGGDVSLGFGINDSGTVVGASHTTLGSFILHAFTWSAGHMTDLGTLGGRDSAARAINNSGDIAGYSSTTTHGYHACLWKNGQMTDLGTLGGSESCAFAINASGAIVGDSLIDAMGDLRHAFLWNGKMVDLAPFHSGFSSARGINSSGDVVGYAQLPSGAYRAFLYRQGTVYDLNNLLNEPTNTTVTYAYGIDDAGQICGIAMINGAPHAVLLTTTSPPTVKTAASAMPNPVTGTTTTLSAFGSDAGAGGEPALTYTWAVTSGPPGVTFSANGTNAARCSKATFTEAGAYTFAVSIANEFGQTVISSVNVTVNQTPRSITVAPGPSLTLGPPLPKTQQFTATAGDQFGNPLSPQPAISWSLGAGSVGSIGTTSGIYHSGSVDGSATVKAKAGAISAAVTVWVNPPVTVANAAAANPNSATGTTTILSALGAYAGAGGAAGLTYTWSVIGPGAVAYSANGTNAAQNTTATFTEAGSYAFTVTIAGPYTSTTSSVTVTVNQTLTSIAVTPGPTLTINPPLRQAQQFTASALDQFGNALSTLPTIAWGLAPGSVGSISTGGLYHSGSVAGSASIRAQSSGVMGTCVVTVN